MTQHFERPKFQGILEYYLNSNCELDTQLNEFKQGNPQYHQLNNQNLQMPPALKRNMRLVIIEIIPQILVSDGHNFIEAIFSKESINEFRRYFSHIKFSNLRDKVIYVSKWSLQIDSVDSTVEFNSYCNFTVRLVVEQFKPILHETLNSRLTHGAQSVFRNPLIQTLIRNFRHWFSQQMIEANATNEQQESQFVMPELSAIFDPKKRGTNLNQSQLPTQLSDDNSDTINNFGAIIQKTEVFRFKLLDFEEKKGLSDMPLFSEHILIKKKNQSRELRIADMDRIIIQEKGEQYYADKKFSKSRQWSDQVSDEVLREELMMKIKYFQVGTKTVQTISSHFETVKQKEDRERLLRNKNGYRSNRRIVGYTLGQTASSIKEKLLSILNHSKKRAVSTPAVAALQAAPAQGEGKRKRANSQENILKMQQTECNTKQEPTEFFDHAFIGNRSREPLSQYVVNQMPNFNDDTQSEQDSLDAAVNLQLENERKNRIAYQDAQLDHVMNATQDMLKVTMFRKYLSWFENNDTMRNTEDSQSKSDQNASATKSSQNNQFIESTHGDAHIRQEQNDSQEQMQQDNQQADDNDQQREEQRRDEQDQAQQQPGSAHQQSSNPILNIEDVSMNQSSQQTVVAENTEKIIKVEHEEPSQESEQFVSKYTMGENLPQIEKPGEEKRQAQAQQQPVPPRKPGFKVVNPQPYHRQKKEVPEPPIEVHEIFNLDQGKNLEYPDQVQAQTPEVPAEVVQEETGVVKQLEKTLEQLKKQVPVFEPKAFVGPEMSKPIEEMADDEREIYEIELEMAQSDHDMEEKMRFKQHLTQKKSYIQRISEIKEQIHQEKERQAAELERQRKIKEEEAAEKLRQIAELEEKIRQQKLKEEQERQLREQREREEQERLAEEERQRQIRLQEEKEEQERLQKVKEAQEEEMEKQRLLQEQQEKQRQLNLQKQAELREKMEMLKIQKEEQQKMEQQAIQREKERQKQLILQKQQALIQQKQQLEQKSLQQQQQIDELDWEEGDQVEIKKQEQERYDAIQNGYVDRMSNKFGQVIDNEVRRLQGKDIVRRQVKNNKNPDKLYDLLQISEIARTKKERKDQQQLKADQEKKQQENFQDAQLACSGIVFTQEENSSFNNNRHVDEEFEESNQTHSHHSSPEKMEQVEQQQHQVQMVETHEEQNEHKQERQEGSQSSYSEIEEDDFSQQYLAANKQSSHRPSETAEVVELSSGLNNDDIEEINHMSPQKDAMEDIQHDQRSSSKKQGPQMQQDQHLETEEEQEFYDDNEEEGEHYQEDDNEEAQYQSPESFNNKKRNQGPSQQMQNQFQLPQEPGIQANEMSAGDQNSAVQATHLKHLQDQIANLQNQLTSAMQSINVMTGGGSQGNLKQGAPMQQTQGQQHAVKSFDCRSVDDAQENGLPQQNNSVPSVSSEEEYQVPTFGSQVQKGLPKDKRQAQYAELPQQGVGSKRKFVHPEHHRERSRSQEAHPRGIQVQNPQYGISQNNKQSFANLTEFANIQRMQTQKETIQSDIQKYKQQKVHQHRMHKQNMKMPNGDHNHQQVANNQQMPRSSQHQRPMQSQGGMKPVNGHQQQQRSPSRDRDSQREYHQQRMMQQSQPQRGQMMQNNPNMRQRGSSLPNQGMCGQQQVQPMRQQQAMQRSPQRQPMSNHMSQQMGSGQKNNMMRSSKQGSPRSPPRGMTQAKNIGQNKRYMHSQQTNGHNQNIQYAQEGQPMKLKQSPSQSHLNQQRIQQVQWQYSSNPQAQKRRRIDEQ